MRVGSVTPARALAALFLILPLARLHANPCGPFGETVTRIKEVLPLNLLSSPPPTPQAVLPADAQGPSVNPGRLADPGRLERDLRAALRTPLATTRLTVVGGTARIGHLSVGSAETVRGHLVVLKGDAEVHGRIEGNLVTLDGDITMHPGAVVVGDVLAIGGRVRELGGSVTGTVTNLEAAAEPSRPSLSIPQLIAERGAGLVGVFLTLLVLGFGLVTFGRPNLEIVSDTVVHSFGRSFTVGLLGQILLLPTFGMLVVGLVLTIAGALLVPFAVVTYALLAIVAILGGVFAVAHAMGEVITRRRMARGLMVSPNAYRYLLTGLSAVATTWLAWVAFGWVPVAGAIILGAAILGTWFLSTVGFGAAILSRGGIREHFAGRLLPPEMMTDEYLWATPQFGVPAIKRPPRDDP